jgi:hypothetical protein
LEKIQEYDLEVKPTEFVKGRGPEKLLAESNLRSLGINHFYSEDSLPHIEEIIDQRPTIQIGDNFSSSSWYKSIVSYLLTLQCSVDMNPSKERTLKLLVMKYCIVN